jgi:hypothetical protein
MWWWWAGGIGAMETKSKLNMIVNKLTINEQESFFPPGVFMTFFLAVLPVEVTPHRVDCRADGETEGLMKKELPFLLLRALMPLLVWRSDCLHLHHPVLNPSLFSKKESQQLTQEISHLVAY